MGNSLIRKTKRKIVKLGEYSVFSHITMKHEIFTLDQIKVFGATLPLRCKGYLESGRCLTPSQNKDMLMLADLSMRVWGGSPKGRLPAVDIEEYYATFYITMCKYLTKLVPEKAGAWVYLCRYMGFEACGIYIKEYKEVNKLKKSLDDLEYELRHLYPEAYADPDTLKFKLNTREDYSHTTSHYC